MLVLDDLTFLFRSYFGVGGVGCGALLKERRPYLGEGRLCISMPLGRGVVATTGAEVVIVVVRQGEVVGLLVFFEDSYQGIVVDKMASLPLSLEIRERE